MSLLRRPQEQRAITSVPWATWLQGGPPPSGGNTAAGTVVTADKAVGVAVVWRCLTLIGDLLSSLPVDTYQKRDGIRVPIEPVPSLVASPSMIYTRREWVFQAVMSAGLWGNVYGLEMAQASNGFPSIVEIVSPNKITVQQKSAIDPPTYLLDGKPVDAEKVSHMRRYTTPGSAVGISPLDTHKELVGTALAAREFAARWFGDGAHPSGMLTTDKDINDPDGTKTATVKQRFMASLRGREPVVMGGGWKYDQVQSTPSDSQLVETWNRIGIDICMAFGVQPEMVGLATQGSSVTYANRDQRALDFLTYSITPWLIMFEDWWTANLPPGVFARFNTGALLRTDILTRHKVHDISLRMGKSSVNEIRALEDEIPIADGNVFLWPPYSTTTPSEGN
jgi:HK97 family phage portal protein